MAAHSSAGPPRPLRRIDPWLACAALLALIPLYAILQPGLPHTADGQVHLLRTLEAGRLLQEGIWYPRWAPDFYLGYGYPFFNFYAPGAHLLAALLALTGLGVAGGVVALEALALVLYPVGAYLAARSLLPGGPRAALRGPAALLGAALYLYAPLRFRELFVQGNLSQWLALALLPWCAWLLIGVARQGGLGRSAAAGAGLAALLYAHHPSAFLGWPSLAAFAAVLALLPAPACDDAPQRQAATETAALPEGTKPPDRWRRLAAVCGSFLLAAALGAPFWLPSVVELRDANLNAIATGSFSARLNLLPLRELLALPAIQDSGALNPPMPNSLGIAQAVLALLGIGAAARWTLRRGALASVGSVEERQAGPVLLAAAALLAVSLFLMLPPAAGLWEALPLARFIAFPWRLLGPSLLWAALLGGAALYLLPDWIDRRASAPLSVLLALVLAAVAPYLFPRPFGPAAEPDLAALAQYELGGGALATASANEYLPRWVEDDHPPAVIAEDYLAGRPPDRLDASSLPEGSRADRLEQRSLEERYALELTAPAAIRLRRFYFPGWQAWIDGRPATVSPSGPYGLLAVTVPAGRHELQVAFGTTPARRVGSLLAGLGVVTVAGLWLWQRRAGATRRPGEPLAWQPPDGRQALAAGIAIALLAALVLGVIGPHTQWFRRQSPAAAPAGMQHAVHAAFGNGVELVGYDLTTPEARQGGTVEVRLYWRALRPGATNARPFLHLDALTGDATWANQTKLNAGDKPMAGWPPDFFVVDDYRLEVPQNTPAVTAQLRAGLLAGGGELVPLAEGGDTAALGTLRIAERAPLAAGSVPNHEQPYQLGPAVRLAGYEVHHAAAPSRLEVTLYWQATTPVPADYTVFLHVRDAEGRPVTQQDGPPVGGRYPSSQWAIGQVIPDRRVIELPSGRESAAAQVAVGLYTPADGQRAPASDAAGRRLPNDEILLNLH